MDNNKSAIPDLPDTEFISFLYSERDRENSLSLYQGVELLGIDRCNHNHFECRI